MDPQPCTLKPLSQQGFGNTSENNSSSCIILTKKLPTDHILIKKSMTLCLQKSIKM